MSSTPPPQKPPEQLHYENLITFFKYAVGITGSLIVTLAAIAIYFSYSDRNAMREEYTKAITDLKSQIIDLKNDARETTKNIKDDSKEAVRSTQEYSEKEIGQIKISTNDIALKETQKNIDAIFATDKIQNLIENQAVKEIKSKVEIIVSDVTKNISRINDAGTKMREGFQSGMLDLKYFFLHPENSFDSLRAKNLYDAICLDYYNSELKHKMWVNIKVAPIINKHIPDSTTRGFLLTFINRINDPSSNLDLISTSIMGLNKLGDFNFKPFEIDEINKWYNSLQK